MAEPEDSIRKLKFPPTPKWGQDGRPSTKTLREDISRYYEPAGGLDKAVESAQQAMQITESPFTPWDPRDLDKQIPVVMRPLPGKRNGEYWPDPQQVVLSSTRPLKQYTLEHERTHALTGPDQWQSPPLTEADSPYAREREAQYLMRHGEIDARLANIKRHYAYNTGKIVTTPQEAEEAIKWWGRNSEDFMQQAPETEQPSYPPKAEAGTYLMLPQEEKMKVLRRMPELVNSNLIERLGQYG